MRMRKEYYPTMGIFAASAAAYIVAAVGYFTHGAYATPVFLGAIALHLFASSRLVKVGRQIAREEEEKREEEENVGK